MVTIEIPPVETVEAIPQNIDLDIVHEDGHIIVLNKPSGLVVHPGAGNPDGTLQNALLFHFPDLAAVPRAGIVLEEAGIVKYRGAHMDSVCWPVASLYPTPLSASS